MTITDQMVEAALQAYCGQDHQLDFGVLPDYIAAMRAALEAADAAAWQPIETAPMDGGAVLCWPFVYFGLFEGRGEQEIVVGYFSDDDWWCENAPTAKRFEPTHWRPLPAAPKETT